MKGSTQSLLVSLPKVEAVRQRKTLAVCSINSALFSTERRLRRRRSLPYGNRSGILESHTLSVPK